jgi:hypothetical protein
MDILIAALRSLLVWLRIIQKPDLLAKLVTDRPEPGAMKPGWIYVVGGKGYQKWAYFRCPADHDELINLSLMQNRRPCWQVTIDALGRPTINPSVRQLDGSYAHFWVRNGKVDWCADTGRAPRRMGSGGIEV